MEASRETPGDSGGVVKYKVCMVGESGVGKTSLVRRFVLDVFDDKYITTIGTKVMKKTVQTARGRADMMLWDIMGQHAYRRLLQQRYFSGAKGVVAVCDVTRPETLGALREWIDTVKSVVGNVPVVVLANKSDLSHLAMIKEEGVRNFSTRLDAPYFFTSAKTGENVEKAFLTLAEMVDRR